MRTAAELIEEARFDSNNVNDDRFNDSRMLKYLNTAIRSIQKVLFNSNPQNNIFSVQEVITIQQGITEYDLPEDIYSVSSLVNITPINNAGNRYKPLDRIDIKERNNTYGYYVIGSQFFITNLGTNNNFQSLELTYTQRVPLVELTVDEPELPEELEDYLILYMVRKIKFVDSSADVATAIGFTAEERQDLEALFKNHQRDIKRPVISDETYYNY